MSWIRWAGALLLPLSGWFVGDAVQSCTHEHLAALEKTIALLQRIQQEILYQRTDLKTLCQTLCREGVLPMETDSLQTLSPLSANMTTEEQRCFQECMNGLGHTEAAQEGERLQYYRVRFESFLQQARQNAAARAELPHKLGFAAGAALALILL